jgi:hypothetical protein
VTGVRGRILGLWKAESLPYPEPGVRLIRQDRIDTSTAGCRSCGKNWRRPSGGWMSTSPS